MRNYKSEISILFFFLFLVISYTSVLAQEESPDEQKEYWLLYSEKEEKIMLFRDSSIIMPVDKSEGKLCSLKEKCKNEIEQRNEYSFLLSSQEMIISIKEIYGKEAQDFNLFDLDTIEDNLDQEIPSDSIEAFFLYNFSKAEPDLIEVNNKLDYFVEKGIPKESVADAYIELMKIKGKTSDITRSYIYDDESNLDREFFNCLLQKISSETPALVTSPTDAGGESFRDRIEELGTDPILVFSVLLILIIGSFTLLLLLYFNMRKRNERYFREVEEISYKLRKTGYEIEDISSQFKPHDGNIERIENLNSLVDNIQKKFKPLEDKLENYTNKITQIENIISENIKEQQKKYSELRNLLIEHEKEIFSRKNETPIQPHPKISADEYKEKHLSFLEKFYAINQKNKFTEIAAKLNEEYYPRLAKSIKNINKTEISGFIDLFNKLMSNLNLFGEEINNEKIEKYFEEKIFPFVDEIDEYFKKYDFQKKETELIREYETYLKELWRILRLEEIEVDIFKEKFNGEKHQLVNTIVNQKFPIGTIITVHKRGFIFNNSVLRKPWITQSSK